MTDNDCQRSRSHRFNGHRSHPNHGMRSLIHRWPDVDHCRHSHRFNRPSHFRHFLLITSISITSTTGQREEDSYCREHYCLVCLTLKIGISSVVLTHSSLNVCIFYYLIFLFSFESESECKPLKRSEALLITTGTNSTLITNLFKTNLYFSF